ncbi:MAG: fibronectin type III domain-containing protein [Fluviicola sp.]
MQMWNLGRIVRLWGFSMLLLLLCASPIYAQEFQTVSKVSNDTIWLKWLPANYDALLKLKNGATVKRIEVSSNQNLSSQNFENGKQWTIAPVKERFDALNRTDSLGDRTATLLEPILSPLEEAAQNFAFGSVLIENVVHPHFQIALGNFIADDSYDRKKRYVYKIEIEKSEPLFAYIDPSKETAFTKPVVELELDQRKTVVCSWNLSTLRNESFGFDVEHSISDTKHAVRLFEEPYLPFKSEFEINEDEVEIRHEDPEKGKMHYYRVIGRDAFGASANASDWKGIYVPNRIDVYPTIDSVEAKGQSRIVHVHMNSENYSGIERIQLLRSTERDGGFEIIDNISFEKVKSRKQIQMISEVSALSGDAYYYKAALLNKDDTVYSQPFYFFTLDQEAPFSPNGLEIEIDSNGIALLTWNELEDPDLLGYRVFRGNSIREEFVERTNVLSLQTSWTDTLALDNLTSEVYYYIQGVDANYNQGAHSDTVMGLKPDTIPPVAGLIRKISMVDAGIVLEITPSSSADAVSNVLFRGTASLGEVGEEYLDTNLVPGQFYEYHIETIDRSDNRALSKKVSQKYEPGFREAPKGSIRSDFQENFIEIEYELPQLDIYSVQIYRCKKGDASRLWKTVHDVTKTKVLDRSIRIGEAYVYKVKYITEEGIHSLPLELETSF